MAYMKFSDMFIVPDYTDPSQMVSGTLDFDDEKCVRCRLCTVICPARSIGMDNAVKGMKKPLPHLQDIVEGVSGCVACGCCCAACPEGAISVTGGFYATRYYTRLHQAKELSFPMMY
ncbi:MAG: 4Fe-4S binding protein [Deltaproteobacteria bacterium]|nr:4Fe-4S binding protein [Deltaproteobacteria bacterium]